MKIAIIGVGAIGGYVGTRLALAGEEVTFIARGANLEALQSRGIKLVLADGSEETVPRVRATADFAAAGPQDVVILAMKAHQVADAAPHVPKLFNSATTVLPMQNGIPYWYFHEHPSKWAGSRIQSVDPTGTIAEHIPCERVVGCVVYPATELLAPGVIQHVEGNRFPVGEPNGSESERVTRISNCLTAAGLKAPVLPDIRAEIWLKLWGNVVFNPVSALTHATLADICRFPPTRALAAAMIRRV